MTIHLRTIAVVLLLLQPLAVQAARNAAPPGSGESVWTRQGVGCEGGVALDDGTLEAGYGWVPSVVDGRYVQRFEVSDFRSRLLEEVCVCWTRTRPDDEMDFEVQLYRDVGGFPSLDPIATVTATAEGVPEFPDGAFYTIDVSGAGLHAITDVFYLGVKWNPSVDGFFFVCVDRTETTPVVDGWFIDDRAEDWTSVLESNDPIFDEHRAMMIRARAAEGFYPTVPTMGPVGIVVMVVALALIAAQLLRRRE